MARVLARRLRLSRGWALAVAAVGSLLILAGAFAFFGFRFEAQVAELIHSLPPAWARLRQSLTATPMGAVLLKTIDQLLATPVGKVLGHLRGYAVSTGAAVLGAILMAVAGLYLAAQPNTYRGGLLRLLAAKDRPEAERFLSTAGQMLRHWLVAQAIAMAVVGLAMGVGFWLIGVPAAAALGVLAAIGEFVPLLGVVIASTPALILAATHGWMTIAWTLGLLVVIHQLDGNLLQPLLQKGMVSIPPVLSLFALIGFGAFFGVMGVLFAAPLTIVCIAAVKTCRPGG